MVERFVLSLFPGIDVLGLGFEYEGFVVVRGPDPIWGSLHDVRRFHPPEGVFEGVIGGPPCQPFSTLGKYARSQVDDLVGEFARVVAEAAPLWFLMENVPGAPSPRVEGYAIHAFNLNLRHLVALCQRCHLSIQAHYRVGQLWLPFVEPPAWAVRRGLA